MKMKTALGLLAAVGMISCGMNPFGSGAQGGLDLYAKVGKNTAYDVVIPVSVTNGAIRINFVSQVDNAKVSAILEYTL